MLKFYTLLVTFILPIILYSKNNDNHWKNEILKQKETNLINLNKSIKIGNNIINNCKNDSILAHSYAMLGTAYTAKGEYINAFKYCYKAKEIFTLESHDLKYLIYNNIALSEIYKRIGLVERAKEELENTLTIVDNTTSKNYYVKASLKISYGNILYDLHQHNSALKLYLEAEKELKKINDTKLLYSKQKLLSILYSEISNTYIAINNLEKAEVYINLAINTLGHINSFDIEHVNTITLAEVYSQTNRERKAIELLKPLYDHTNVEPVFNQFIHEILSKSYKNIGDETNYKKEKIKSDSIQHLFVKNQSKGLKEAYKFIDNDLKNHEKQQSKFKIITFIIITLFILSIVFGIIFYQKKLNKEKKAYQLLISSIKKPKIINQPKTEQIEYSKSELALIEKLEKFELDKGFLKKDLTLAVFAVELNTNVSYLSDIVNKYKNKNINTYLNELRINYIITEVYNNPTLLNYKISHLANLAGFNSHNSFSLVFKKITKISPSIFLQERRNELSKNKTN